MKTYTDLLNQTDEEIIKMYLDWVNNFITLSKFAEYYDITELDAHYIIDLGRKLNNELSTSKN